MKYNVKIEQCGVFKLLGGMMANDAGCTREIKCSIAVAKAAFNKQKALCTSKLDYEFKEGTSKVLHLEHNFVWC